MVVIVRTIVMALLATQLCDTFWTFSVSSVNPQTAKRNASRRACMVGCTFVHVDDCAGAQPSPDYSCPLGFKFDFSNSRDTMFREYRLGTLLNSHMTIFSRFLGSF